MPTFIYQAIGMGGGRSDGEVEGRSRQDALRRLESQKLQVISLRQKEIMEPAVLKERNSPRTPVNQGNAILSRSQIILFTEELSDLLEAGLQLEPALRTMEKRQELGGLKEVVVALREKVVEGTSFSTALRGASRSFGDLYCNLVAAGEISGALSPILRRQAQYLQAIDELQSRVIQALIYPSFIFLAGSALMVIFITYLVPQLTRLLKETGKSMPIPARILIGFSDFMVHYGLFILVALIFAGIGFWMLLQRPEGRLWWDEKKLKLPLFGTVLASQYYAQFSQTMANLVANGIPLLNALKLQEAATGNLYFRILLSRVIVIVGEGGAFSRALKSVGTFPLLLIDMITVGEQTGDMAAALEKVAQRYDRELSRRIQHLTALIQPTIIIIMALMVGFVAYSMISGIFQSITGMRMR